jgi:hypothetical protein
LLDIDILAGREVFIVGCSGGAAFVLKSLTYNGGTMESAITVEGQATIPKAIENI